LDRVTAQTLIVWGDQDTHALREEQQALLDAMPNASLLVYEGAGHSLQLEEPARLAADLAAFIKKLGL
jgi:pimeloyl-ACP methyl ester carboxylesterase